ncbi:MAG: hypothetical protein KKE57_11555, partial [Proteobacteria bacterium]|nr:hypothetical protein [Pseudomonadota bacterium]
PISFMKHLEKMSGGLCSAVSSWYRGGRVELPVLLGAKRTRPPQAEIYPPLEDPACGARGASW